MTDAHLVDPSTAETVEVLGPTVQFLTPLSGADDEPCVMRGTIPPGVAVPLHRHPDPETFLMVSGGIEGLSYADGEGRWVPIRAGDVFHVPGNAKHAFRNPSPDPAVMILVSTNRIGRFFKEVAAPSGDPIRHFQETAERYGYWNATPEQNAAVGLAMPTP